MLILGFELNSFRNGFDDPVGRYFGRMLIIHLIACMEVCLVRTRGAVKADDFASKSLGGRVCRRWYDIARYWEENRMYLSDSDDANTRVPYEVAIPERLREFAERTSKSSDTCLAPHC